MGLFSLLRRWFKILRFSGVSSIKFCPAVLRLYSRRPIDIDSKNKAGKGPRPHVWATSLASLAIAVILLLVQVGVRSEYLSCFVIYFFYLAISMPINVALPPSVLLLAHSGPGTITLHTRISRVINPLLLISLLDFRAAKEGMGLKLHFGEISYLTRFSEYRTAQTDAWPDTVCVLMKVVPIIIIDTRQVSDNAKAEGDNVLDEANWILDKDYTNKTLFLIGNNNEHPILDELESSKRAILETYKDHFVTEERLLDLLWDRTLPTRFRGRLTRSGTYRAAKSQTKYHCPQCAGTGTVSSRTRNRFVVVQKSCPVCHGKRVLSDYDFTIFVHKKRRRGLMAPYFFVLAVTSLIGFYIATFNRANSLLGIIFLVIGIRVLFKAIHYGYEGIAPYHDRFKIGP